MSTPPGPLQPNSPESWGSQLVTHPASAEDRAERGAEAPGSQGERSAPQALPRPPALPKRFGGRWCPPAATRGSACEFALPREGKGALFPLRGAVGPGPPTVDSAHTRDFGFVPPRSEPNQ